jgi:hypothetical protein
MTDLRERLRAADEVPVPELLAEARRRAAEPGGSPSWQEGPRAGRLVAGLVAFALFIGGSVVAARVFLDSEPASSPSASPWTGLDPGWTQLAPPPFERSDAALAWTGEELFMWGGGTDFNANFFSNGALYDPETNEWRAIADGPLAARADADAVWTGSEVLIWGGYGRSGHISDGAAYNPESDSWRRLATLSWPEDPVAVAWTGRELILFGSSVRGDPPFGEPRGFAYDPSSDSWRQIANKPLPYPVNQASAVWTGTEVILYGAQLNERNVAATTWARGLAYDPAADTWRVLPQHHISPQASWANWTGREMLVWDYETNSALYNPATDSWREPSAMPMEFSECYPYSVRTTTSVFAWFCGQMASFDIEADTWERVVQGPVEIERNDPNRLGRPVGAGDVVVMLLQKDDTCCDLGEMWAYRP